MGTKRQNNVKMKHKGKEFVLWAREMKYIRNNLQMLGWANISRACFIDNGGLSDQATCEYSKSAVEALHRGQGQLNNQRTWTSIHLVCSRTPLEEKEIWGHKLDWRSLVGGPRKQSILRGVLGFSKEVAIRKTK